MIETLFFEMQCAENVGNYKLADMIENRLIRIATTNVNSVKKSLKKKISRNTVVKTMRFSSVKQAFVFECTRALSKTEKEKIKKIASPFGVMFRINTSPSIKTAGFKDLDELMDTPGQDEADRSIHNLEVSHPEGLSMTSFLDEEPSDEDLLREEEFPHELDESDLDYILYGHKQKEMVDDYLSNPGSFWESHKAS